MGCCASKDAKMSKFVLDKYEDYGWVELPEDIKKLCEDLGYTKKLWDNDKEPDCMDEDWKDLTPTQQAAAAKLGYDEKSWNEED